MKEMKIININQIEKTFRNVSNTDISALGLSLIKELKFMETTLKKLKKEIKDNGVIVKMSQGKYDIERANPAIASYNSMIKNYNTNIKQIYEMLSSDILNDSNDPNDNFDDDDLS